MWETPQELFDKLNDHYHFTLDVCAIPENTKCSNYFTPTEDGLTCSWGGITVGATHHTEEKSENGSRKLPQVIH